jgi:hypothetical protein
MKFQPGHRVFIKQAQMIEATVVSQVWAADANDSTQSYILQFNQDPYRTAGANLEPVPEMPRSTSENAELWRRWNEAGSRMLVSADDAEAREIFTETSYALGFFKSKGGK